MKRVLLTLMVALLAVPVTYAQEAEDAAEEAAVEATVEAVEEVPAAPAEEASGFLSALSGFTVGLNVAMPVIAGKYYTEGDGSDPVFGVVIGTPYGMPLGPFTIGLNAGIESANGMFGVFGILNAAVAEIAGGPVSVFGGVGMLEGMGIIGGVSWDYPMDPVVIKPYVRGTITTAGATVGGVPDGDSAPTGWIQVGAMVSYAL